MPLLFKPRCSRSVEKHDARWHKSKKNDSVLLKKAVGSIRSWWFMIYNNNKVSADYQLRTNCLKSVNPRTAPMWIFCLFREIAISLKLPVDEPYFKWNSNNFTKVPTRKVPSWFIKMESLEEDYIVFKWKTTLNYFGDCYWLIVRFNKWQGRQHRTADGKSSYQSRWNQTEIKSRISRRWRLH